MTDNKPKSRVREPVQVYLDQPDRLLLEEMAEKMGLPRTEILRRGLRRLAERVLPEHAPGWSIDGLIGSLGDIEDVPEDLAERHDAYLYKGRKGDTGGPG
jgi:hypothetical protein